MTHASKTFCILPALVLGFGNIPAAGQPLFEKPASWESPEPAAAREVLLHEGTPVLLAFAGNVTSATAEKGQTVSFVLVNDVTVDGVVIAKAGSKASGEIVFVKKAAVPGKGGELDLRPDHLQVGGQKVPLRASKERNGERLFHYRRPYRLKWPMGLMRTGDNVEIRQGTVLAVYVAQDISVSAAE